MSSAIANTVGTALYVCALLPVAAAAFWGGERKILTAYAVGLIGLIAIQTGIFHGSALAPTDVTLRVNAPPGEQCKQVLELMWQSGLHVDRSDPGTPRIVGNGAEQIPPELRDLLLSCSEQAEPTEEAGPGDARG